MHRKKQRKREILISFLDTYKYLHDIMISGILANYTKYKSFFSVKTRRRKTKKIDEIYQNLSIEP